jgi:hypothetical protein
VSAARGGWRTDDFRPVGLTGAAEPVDVDGPGFGDPVVFGGSAGFDEELFAATSDWSRVFEIAG